MLLYSMLKNLHCILSILLIQTQWAHHTDNVSSLACLSEQNSLILCLVQYIRC